MLSLSQFQLPIRIESFPTVRTDTPITEFETKTTNNTKLLVYLGSIVYIISFD